MQLLIPDLQQRDCIAHLEEGDTMPKYKVRINDNAHYMDESERADHGVFANADEAVAACKEIVDDDLNAMWKPGTTAKELYKLYVGFGPDPFVVPLNPKDPGVEFSAWAYAKKRCKDLASLRH
jgi:hypothetical protein